VVLFVCTEFIPGTFGRLLDYRQNKHINIQYTTQR